MKFYPLLSDIKVHSQFKQIAIRNAPSVPNRFPDAMIMTVTRSPFPGTCPPFSSVSRAFTYSTMCESNATPGGQFSSMSKWESRLSFAGRETYGSIDQDRSWSLATVGTETLNGGTCAYSFHIDENESARKGQTRLVGGIINHQHCVKMHATQRFYEFGTANSDAIALDTFLQISAV